MITSRRITLIAAMALLVAVPVSFAQRGGGGGGGGFGGGGGGGGGRGGGGETEQGLRILNADFVRVVYPYELAMAGTDARVRIRYRISAEGVATSVNVAESENADVTASVLAAMDEMAFETAMERGQPVISSEQTLDVTIRQLQRPSDLAFIDVVKDQATQFSTPQQLDGGGLRFAESPPPPVFPSSLRGRSEGGNAVVEFYIDDTGSVQLPRIVEATDPAFGWSLASAVLTWKFQPPMRNGAPAKVRVTGLPFGFQAPQQAAP